ncbi:MAG TPA: AMP-binding protein [Myxococcota bacterium]|nr:AMP-binding protein [Myxococcota bacterium]
MSELERQLGNYRRQVDGFRWDVPDAFNFGRDVVDRRAREADGPALLWRDASGAARDLRWSDVRSGTNRMAQLARALGIRAGEPVIVLLPKVPEWQLAVVGLLKAGALVIPSATSLRPKDIAYRAQHSGAVAVIAGPESTAAVDAARAGIPGVRHFLALAADGARPPEGWESFDEALRAQPDDDVAQRSTRARDPALVYYTSGTTGPPKAVLHDHAYTYAQRYTSRFWHGVRAGQRIWTTSDTGWAKAAYGVLFGPWSEGAEVVLYHGRFEPRAELDFLMHVDPHVFCAPPTEFRLLVKADLSGLRLPRLRECVSAGEPLNPEVIRAWQQATGLWIRDGYGQTETILLIANLPGMPVKPGSMGLPMPGHELEVIDERGEAAPPGEVGDIALRGDPPSLFRGYWKDPEASARCRRGDWYVTGDRAFRDEDGYFWFVGRDDDVIISAGYRIGPFEVESALVEHPDVLEAAAVAAPDPDRGAVVKAFVVLRPGVRGDAALVARLQQHVKSVTAPYKYPRQIEFVDSLPKTVSGKIRRVELRARP